MRCGISRRGFAAWGLGGLAALSGCSPTIGPPAGTAPLAPTTPTVVPAGETLGTGTVRIAMLIPSSAPGNARAIAANLRNAAELALREFKGANLQILMKDDKGTAEGARAAAIEAIGQGAELIIGPLFAPSVSAAGAAARTAGVPVIAFSTDANVAARGVYLLSFLPQTDVERIIGFAASRGKRSIVALLPANGYGTVVEAALQNIAPANGSRVVQIERYSLDLPSMQQKAEAVSSVLASGQADTLFMPDAGDAAPPLAQILAARGIRPGQVQMLGSGQWDDPRIVQEAALRGGWYPAPDKTGYDAFAARYRAAFGQAPLRPASLAYDAVSLAAGLASRFGAQRFAFATITNPNGFIGVDGAFRFLPDGKNQRGLAVYEVGAGTATLIDAAPKTFARTGF